MDKIDFATVGDMVGARAKVRFGPKIEGEIIIKFLPAKVDTFLYMSLAHIG